MMAGKGNSARNWTKSRCSLTEFAQLLKCEGCYRIAGFAHVLAACDHTFCLQCARKYRGDKCPVCKMKAEAKSCKPGYNNTLLVNAYEGIAMIFGIGEAEGDNGERPIGETENLSGYRDSCKLRRLQSCSTVVMESSQNEDFGEKHIMPISSKKHYQAELQDNSTSSILDNSTYNTLDKLEKRNRKGETLLHSACVKKDFSKVKEIIGQGGNPNTKDNAGLTPLHDAVLTGSEQIVEFLLQNGANPNVPGIDNATSLHEAVIRDNASIVKMLVASGADTEARSASGQTPWDMAQSEAVKAALLIPKSVTKTIDREWPCSSIPVVHALNVNKKTCQHFTKLSRKLGFKMLLNYSNQVTHVVVDKSYAFAGEHKNNLYSAALQGQWIVDMKWLQDSESEIRLRDPSTYEIDCRLHPQVNGSASRLNRRQQLPGLFNNCHFFLQGEFTSVAKADLAVWIKHGSGRVLTRMPNPENISPTKCLPYHAKSCGPLNQCCHFILYDEAKSNPVLLYKMNHLKSLPVNWLVACIEAFTLLDPF